MKRSRFTEQQIVGFLKQVESGLPVKDVCRQGGFSEATFYESRFVSGTSVSTETSSPASVQSVLPGEVFMLESGNYEVTLNMDYDS